MYTISIHKRKPSTDAAKKVCRQSPTYLYNFFFGQYTIENRLAMYKRSNYSARSWMQPSNIKILKILNWQHDVCLKLQKPIW